MNWWWLTIDQSILCCAIFSLFFFFSWRGIKLIDCLYVTIEWTDNGLNLYTLQVIWFINHFGLWFIYRIEWILTEKFRVFFANLEIYRNGQVIAHGRCGLRQLLSDVRPLGQPGPETKVFLRSGLKVRQIKHLYTRRTKTRLGLPLLHTLPVLWETVPLLPPFRWLGKRNKYIMLVHHKGRDGKRRCLFDAGSCRRVLGKKGHSLYVLGPRD